MIEADKRKAIFLLHQEGMPRREIARRLQVSRNTVAVVIAQGGQLPKLVRSPKQKIDSQLLSQRLVAHEKRFGLARHHCLSDKFVLYANRSWRARAMNAESLLEG